MVEGNLPGSCAEHNNIHLKCMLVMASLGVHCKGATPAALEPAVRKQLLDDNP